MKKILISAVAVIIALSQTALASGLSSWAEAGYDSVNSAGLIPYSIAVNDFSGSITREEFCELIMNMYFMLSGPEPQGIECAFEDTDNASVIKAYSLGIVHGKSETKFCPGDFITRQEMAKTIIGTLTAAGINTHLTTEDLEKVCAFEDFGDTDDWAATDVAKNVKYEIMNGVTEKTILPRGTATREQAIVMVSRALDSFAGMQTYYQQPEIENLYDTMSVSGNFEVKWSKVQDASEYVMIVKDENDNCVFTAKSSSESALLKTGNLEFNKTYYVSIGAKINDNTMIFSDTVEIYCGTEQNVWNNYTSLQDRYNRVFPSGTAFLTEEEAAYNMVSVTVPVWRMKSDGSKYSSTASIIVNRNLAAEVKNIFAEIYNDPEKFPIKDVGGYSWRNTALGGISQHSYGTCIDINADENYYCYASTGEAITGSFWKPGENPYSITENGSVVRAFAKYGWTWGGNAWTSLKDYMHFTYLGK